MSDKKIEFLKEIYYFEHERHKNLNNKMMIPITILTLIFGVITYFIQNIHDLDLGLWSIIFYTSFGVVLICIAFAIYYLIRAYFNYGYWYFPKPVEIDNYFEKLKNHYKDSCYKNNSKSEIESLIEEDINSFIYDLYKEGSEINVSCNEKKSKYLHKTTFVLILIIIFLFLSSLTFYKLNFSLTDCQRNEFINTKNNLKWQIKKNLNQQKKSLKNLNHQKVE